MIKYQISNTVLYYNYTVIYENRFTRLHGSLSKCAKKMIYGSGAEKNGLWSEEVAMRHSTSLKSMIIIESTSQQSQQARLFS